MKQSGSTLERRTGFSYTAGAGDLGTELQQRRHQVLRARCFGLPHDPA